MSQNTPRVLYHYCSLSTFKNIIDTRSVWLSDIRRSNDSLELKWIMGKCQLHIIEAWTSYVKVVQAERGMDIVTLDHFNQFDDLYNLAKRYDAEDDTKNWVFCLSQKSDDLGQWRGYADDGKGIAIGFNSSVLKQINYIGNKVRNASIDFKFDKVHYSKREIKSFFENIIGLSKITKDMSPEEVLGYIKRALGYSYIFAPLYKSDSFKDEQEWRIVYSMYLNDLKDGGKPGIANKENDFLDILKLEKYAFVQKGDTLVSHLELEFSKMKNAIHSITIGPKANVNITDIRLYLMSVGLLDNANDKSIDIRRSNISYK